MNSYNENFQGSFGLSINNFDPSNITTDETINVVFVVDKSGSVNRFVSDLNAVLNDFVQTMQKSHVCDKMLVSTILFNQDIDVVNGYQPLSDVKTFNINPSGSTNLYNAVYTGIENALHYRQDLEKQGISCKTLVFVITDGEDNEGGTQSAAKVKQLIKDVYSEEANFGTFTIMMFGLGQEANFDYAREEMGIQKELLAKLGTSSADLRKMIGFISASVSSSANGTVPTSISF